MLQQRSKKLAQVRSGYNRHLRTEMLEPRWCLDGDYLDPGPPDVNELIADPVPGETDTASIVASGLATYALTSVPILNSLAGAAVSLYLNFVGRFDATWGGYQNITTPPFDQDGDTTTFSDGELTTISNVWQAVAEDYAPFKVNVTTVEPPSFANGTALMVAIGGNGSWTGATYGGIAYVNSFTNSSPNTVFVFPKNLGNGYAKYVADASSHEAGHGFGLYHQSQYGPTGSKIAEYYTGPGDGTAPLMGNSYNSPRSLWWYGTSTSSTTNQDDMAVIARSQNSFGYRPDDHGNTSAAATALSVAGNQLSGSGIITTTSDLDYFSFTTGGGQLALSVDVAAYNNLDARIELREAGGALIASAAPANSFGATINATVAAGSYRLVVASGGGYGNVGQYSVSGSITAAVNHAPAGSDATIALVDDSIYTLTTLDFGFSDPSDSPPNALLAVKITTLPAIGLLTNLGVAVTAGQFISAVDILAGRLQFRPVTNTVGMNYDSFTFQVQDNGGTAGGGSDLDPSPNQLGFSWESAAVLDRLLFYNQSKFDGYDPGIAAADDQAIAIDKVAYLPGAGAATFANISSYSNGINGIMIDISGSRPSITASDFTFKIGNNNSPDTWVAAAPAAAVSVRVGAGAGGSDRVEIVWPNHAVENTWLQVTVAANANTGLAAPDVFYFGSAVGNSGLGDSVNYAMVNSIDEIAARNNSEWLPNNIPVTNVYDYNRDGSVNANDQVIARAFATNPSSATRYINLGAASGTFDAQTPDTAWIEGPVGNDNTAAAARQFSVQSKPWASSQSSLAIDQAIGLLDFDDLFEAVWGSIGSEHTRRAARPVHSRALGI
jgi:hypothetical protein